MEDQKPYSFYSKWGFLALQVVIVLLALAVGAFGYRFIDQQQGELALLRRAQEILVQNTIYEIPASHELEYGMIQGMLNTVDDPFTRFVPPAENEIQSDQLSGQFGGIGARLERDTLNRWRLYPLPESQALEAGLQDADILLAVDGQAVTPETSEVDLLALLRGPVGDRVTLTVERQGQTLSLRIRRQQIELPSVVANLLPEDGRIGLIQVIRIAETTEEEITTSIANLLGQGAQALILDLRDNGGGLVDAGVAVARLFLAQGEVLRQQFRDREVEVFEVNEPGPYTEIPMVILVNNNTASAAEILAGALVKHGRAALIGTPSYGKATIQYIFDLQDGSSVHITSGRWWIPGVDVPLQPGMPLAPDAGDPAYIQAAIDALAGHLP